MNLSKKSKQLLLGVALLAIIIFGSSLLFFSNKEDKETQQPNNTAILPATETYYVEKMLFEEHRIHEPIAPRFMNYKGDVAKIAFTEDSTKLVSMTSMEPITDIPDEVVSASAYFLDENSNFITVKYDKEEKNVLVRTFNQGGNIVDEPISLNGFKGIIIDDSYIMVEQLKVDSKYIYLLSQTNTIPILQVFNKEGSLYASYPMISSFDTDDDGHLYIAFTMSEERMKRGFEKVNIDTDEVEYSIDIKGTPSYIRYSKDADTIYLMDEEGIITYAAFDGKKIEEIFTFGEDSTYMGDSFFHEDFFVGREQDLFLAVSYFKEGDGPVNIYYRYGLTEGTRQEKPVTLTITASYRHDFLADAIIRYELKYPDEKIKYDYQYNSREEFFNNREQHGQQFTLSILAEDIGDIVMTGGGNVVYRQLFKTDAFMDLSDFIKNDKNYDLLNKNVLEGIKIEKAIRGLPISITQPFYEVNTALADSLELKLDYNNLSWRDVISLTKIIEEKAPDSYLFVGMGEGYPLIEMLVSNMPQLIDLENKKVNLNQDWFIKLLEEFKVASKSKNFLQTDYEFNMIDGLHNSLFFHRNNYEFVYYDMIYRYMEYNKDKEKESIYIPYFIGEVSNNRIAHSNNMYSINNKSQNKESAWKFLSFLLEEDIQMLRTLPGKPINTKADKDLLENAANMSSKEYGNDVFKFTDMMTNISRNIDYMYDMDYFKMDIYEPIAKYINDELHLKDALKKAEQNVWIRLNE